MVDRDLLRHKLHLLSRSIAKLDKYRNISLAELAGNEERRDAIERVLHVAVQSCLDIGNHVIADLDLREPADYKDIMVILTEAGILPKEKRLSSLQEWHSFVMLSSISTMRSTLRLSSAFCKKTSGIYAYSARRSRITSSSSL